MPKIKILCLIHSLDTGGAEKIVIKLLNSLDKEHFDPILVQLKRGGCLEQELDESINIINLDVDSKFATIPAVFKFMHTIIKTQADCVFSHTFGMNIIALISTFVINFKGRVIVAEHNFLKLNIMHYSFPRFRKFIIKFLYPKADVVITVSDDVAENLKNDFGIPDNKIRTVYNGVDIEQILKKQEENLSDLPECPYIISVGSLTTQKNHLLLLKSFAVLTKTHNNINLIILGEGELRKTLEQKIEELELSNRVSMPGIKNNPYPFMKKAKAFVLSSLYEGFGIVLTEAMACRLPIVSTECAGASNIIEHEKTGLLVALNNPKSMSEAIGKILNNPKCSENLAENAFAELLSKYSLDKMIREYTSILKIHQDDGRNIK